MFSVFWLWLVYNKIPGSLIAVLLVYLRLFVLLLIRCFLKILLGSRALRLDEMEGLVQALCGLLSPRDEMEFSRLLEEELDEELLLLLDDEELELDDELLELLLLLDDELDEELLSSEESESDISGALPLVFISTSLKYPLYPGSVK